MNEDNKEPIQESAPESTAAASGEEKVREVGTPVGQEEGKKAKRSIHVWQYLKKEIKPDFTTTGIVSNVVTIIATALVVLPVFIFLHRIIPFPAWAHGIDRIFLFIILFLFFYVVFKIIKKFVWVILGLIFTGLLIGTMTDHYGFEDVYWDYRGFITNLGNDAKSLKDYESSMTFPRRQTIINAIEFTNKDIRAFSHAAVKKNFVKYQEGQNKLYIQCIAVWKAINDQWVYIKDPTDREYIAKASESVVLLSGDCDDYSVLMASCLKSIGGKVRLVRTPTHIYPELRFESKADLDNVIYLIRNKLFRKKARNQTIHFHTDKNGIFWLNMDYTAPYPGGKFLSDETIAVLEL